MKRKEYVRKKKLENGGKIGRRANLRGKGKREESLIKGRHSAAV